MHPSIDVCPVNSNGRRKPVVLMRQSAIWRTYLTNSGTRVLLNNGNKIAIGHHKEFWMEFRISDTFTDSLAKLTGDEQKAIKTTAFDLQMNPANPSMQFHRIERARDANFWSIRVSSDIRLIIHKTDASLLLCYVGHHDEAYNWAQRRKIERHPKTGAAQLVEVRETVKEIKVPKYVEVEQPAPPKPPLFANTDDDVLLSYGVPEEWINDVKTITEDTLFDISEHLPHEAAEALLELATGGIPQKAKVVKDDIDPFEHPDAKRRFRVMSNVEELQQALDYPWEKWSVFLHPAQLELVERDFNGPARISGSAGTGKTIVALHRAVYLAKKHRDSRVLLTTFSETLANALRNRLRILIGSEPRLAERLEVHAINDVGKRLYKSNFKKPVIATKKQIETLLQKASAKVENHKFALHFLFTEWTSVIDAWQLKNWEEYQNIKRLGRRKRLAENQRKMLWSIFEEVRKVLVEKNMITLSDMFSDVAGKIESYEHPPFDFAVIDESQDVSVSQLRFLAALGGQRPDCLYFAGDLGQRIFQQPFSWKTLGVDIRGRSHTLKINYRTSHQIRCQADRLLPPSLSDVDGNPEDRRGTISVFDGLPPVIETFEDTDSEAKAVGQWVDNLLNDSFQAHEVGVFVRSSEQLQRAHAALESADLNWVDLDETVEGKRDHVSVCTMHLAKGLEFRAVVVMACDDEIVPLQQRIESAGDESDLEEVYQTERHLLYVACTRARDRLLVTGIDPVSEFIDDMGKSRQ
jgi:superfamily I DNA/RNA helicase/mRNA-degrading endonuclease RelE of RelBE toxin-antitoxin system